jgi:hypothetical protein
MLQFFLCVGLAQMILSAILVFAFIANRLGMQRLTYVRINATMAVLLLVVDLAELAVKIIFHTGPPNAVVWYDWLFPAIWALCFVSFQSEITELTSKRPEEGSSQ